MADPFTPVQRGDPLKMSARTFNAHQNAGKDYSRRKLDENQKPATPGAALPPQIYNGLGSALDEFSVLGFSTVPHVDPAAVPLEASEQPVFEAAEPSPSAPFCITREPIPAGGIGEIVTHGPAVVQVLVSDASHTRAVPIAGEKGHLASAASGGVPILTKDAGAGLKWCEVMLPAAPGGRNLFVSVTTEVTAPDSWQSQTLTAGSWTNDSPTGTDNAYPVLCGGSAFTPLNGAQTIMWEEPPGSGVYAFLPIQFASATVPGFVSTGMQSFGGDKTFTGRVAISGAAPSLTLAASIAMPGGFLGPVTYGGNTHLAAASVFSFLSRSGFGIDTGTSALDGLTTTFLTGDGRTATFTGGILTGLA